MPNYCDYEMKLKGAKEDIDEFVLIMQNKHPTDRFYRVSSAEEYDSGEDYVCLSGEVAWSCYCAFMFRLDDCKGIITIDKVSERLHLEIEVFSTEAGIGFQEHLVFVNGETVLLDCEDYSEYCLYDYEGDTREEMYAAFKEETDLDISMDKFDEDGYCGVGGIPRYGEWTI